MATIGYLEGTDPLVLSRLAVKGIGTLPLSNGFDNHGKFINTITEHDQISLVVGYLHKIMRTQYRSFFETLNYKFVVEPDGTDSNYWLNAIVTHDKAERDATLTYLNDNNVMARPVWQLMSELPMYSSSQCDALANSLYLRDHVINIPSSALV